MNSEEGSVTENSSSHLERGERVGQYNCPGLYTNLASSDHPVASCEDEWLAYRRKCYFFSTTTNSWASAQNSCSQEGATLAVIDSRKDMIFLKRHAGEQEHWIGLKNEANQTWKWANGQDFNHWFNITGSERCASLNNTDITTVDCEASLHWVCSKPFR
uniref:CD69 antigen n=1 Tax=Cricetulus griseus TaxID=10029 RepID=A0A8C2M454_CRIGR